jgi:hypothetical protein
MGGGGFYKGEVGSAEFAEVGKRWAPMLSDEMAEEFDGIGRWHGSQRMKF